MEEIKNKIPLIKKEKRFKLIISKELEDMIRFLCNKLPNKEYSGTLFYSIEGGFDDENLVITAKDFYLQDIGSATFTQFNNDASLVTYMVEHNLLSDFQGLLHSHNTMAKIIIIF